LRGGEPGRKGGGQSKTEWSVLLKGATHREVDRGGKTNEGGGPGWGGAVELAKLEGEKEGKKRRQKSPKGQAEVKGDGHLLPGGKRGVRRGQEGGSQSKFRNHGGPGKSPSKKPNEPKHLGGGKCSKKVSGVDHLEGASRLGKKRSDRENWFWGGTPLKVFRVKHRITEESVKKRKRGRALKASQRVDKKWTAKT